MGTKGWTRKMAEGVSAFLISSSLVLWAENTSIGLVRELGRDWAIAMDAKHFLFRLRHLYERWEMVRFELGRSTCFTSIKP